MSENHFLYLSLLVHAFPGEHDPTDYLAQRIDKEKRIGLQLGTLGGGNHFLEVVYSEGDEQATGLVVLFAR